MADPFTALRRAIRTTQELDATSGDGSLRLVVASVNAFHRERTYAPSVADVAKAMKWSEERTRDAIRALCEVGALVQDRGVARSLRAATDADREKARAAAWTLALQSLPSSELAAVRIALDGIAARVAPKPSTTEAA